MWAYSVPSCVQTPPPAADVQPAEAAGGLAAAGSLKASRAVADLNALNIRHKVGCRFIYVHLPWLWIRLQWFSQVHRFHQQKKAKYYSYKCLLKKFFHWFSKCLRICIVLFLKILIYVMYTMNANFFFWRWVSKIHIIIRWFKCRNNWKKVHPEEVVCKKPFAS